ncbi:hypothetical protein [Stappia indica]|uniref:hypothetical protein n=1 Tax=Stappia indica TaxID=538381 RepID=UPI001D18DE4F|nr:hypothetical protein [Stappia indica]MCC4242901.1 hypothetical protein [Stappia indica]
MHEDIGVAVVRHDEAEALVGLEELHDARLARSTLHRRSATRAAVAAFARAAEAIAAAETVTTAAARATVAATAEAIAATEPVATAARSAITAAAEPVTTAAAARTTVAAAAEAVTTAATRAAVATTAEAVAATFTRAAEAVAAAAGAAVTPVAAETVTRRKGLFRHESRLRSSPTGFAETVAPAAPFGLVALAMVETSVEFVPVPTIVLRTAAPLSLPTIVRTPVFHVHITL